MPKRRNIEDVIRPRRRPGSGGGAAGGGAVVDTSGPYSIETADGRVEILFSTRDPNRAYVVTGAGNLYLAGTDDCTCPDRRLRGVETCVHMQAVRRALGLSGGAVTPGLQGHRVDPEGLERREADDLLPQVSARRNREILEAMQRYEEFEQRYGDGVFISEDETAFIELWNSADWNSVPYQYENVLPDPNATFGVEIEFQHGDNVAIAQELYRLGLSGYDHIRPYHDRQRVPGKWSFERDGTVTDSMNRGGEIVSPVLRDTPETWRQLEQVLEVVKRHGGQVTFKCGGHIHVGKNVLGSTDSAATRLVKIWMGYEDVYYRLAAGGHWRGEHRGYDYTVPSRRQWPNGLPRTLWRLSTVERRFGSHYSALHVESGKPTIEFRTPNGTLDARQIQMNVKVAVGTVLAAAGVRAQSRRGRFIPDSPLGVGAHDSGRAAEDMHKAVRRWLDLVFPRAEDKRAALALYKTSRWQPEHLGRRV